VAFYGWIFLAFLQPYRWERTVAVSAACYQPRPAPSLFLSRFSRTLPAAAGVCRACYIYCLPAGVARFNFLRFCVVRTVAGLWGFSVGSFGLAGSRSLIACATTSLPSPIPYPGVCFDFSFFSQRACVPFATRRTFPAHGAHYPPRMDMCLCPCPLRTLRRCLLPCIVLCCMYACILCAAFSLLPCHLRITIRLLSVDLVDGCFCARSARIISPLHLLWVLGCITLLCCFAWLGFLLHCTRSSCASARTHYAFTVSYIEPAHMPARTARLFACVPATKRHCSFYYLFLLPRCCSCLLAESHLRHSAEDSLFGKPNRCPYPLPIWHISISARLPSLDAVPPAWTAGRTVCGRTSANTSARRSDICVRHVLWFDLWWLIWRFFGTARAIAHSIYISLHCACRANACAPSFWRRGAARIPALGGMRRRLDDTSSQLFPMSTFLPLRCFSALPETAAWYGWAVVTAFQALLWDAALVTRWFRAHCGAPCPSPFCSSS